MTTIFLDWDVSYRDWSSHTRDKPTGKRSVGWMKNRLRLYGRTYAAVYYRRSASGHVHIHVETHVRDTPDALLLRTFLHDDDARVYLDIVRWKEGATTNRLFDTKYKDGKIGKAGPWVLWFKLFQ